jgi:acetyl-CoA carboxylase biotin carboxylase subunit
MISEYHPPGGGGVRVDSGVYGGWRVPSCYDALIAKVITHGTTRADAIAKMRCALDEFIIGGIRTNIPLHQALLRDPDVVEGNMSTRTIERLVAKGF